MLCMQCGFGVGSVLFQCFIVTMAVFRRFKSVEIVLKYCLNSVGIVLKWRGWGVVAREKERRCCGWGGLGVVGWCVWGDWGFGVWLWGGVGRFFCGGGLEGWEVGAVGAEERKRVLAVGGQGPVGGWQRGCGVVGRAATCYAAMLVAGGD